jgi:3-oxoacyl-[acyl-carrier protein] reductase
MDLGIANRRVIVTGGNQGIGLAAAEVLLREGCRVLICGRSKEKLKSAEEYLVLKLPNRLNSPNSRGDLATISADVISENGPEQVLQKAEQLWGGADILINNVGGSVGGGSFLKSTEEQWRQVFELNLFSTLKLCQLSAPPMKARGWGRILNISSIWGKESGGGAAYNAAKAAIISLSKAMAVDLAPHGVVVNCLAPGSILFPGGGWDQRQKANPDGIERFVQEQLPLGRFGSPQEVAAVIAFAVSEQASLLLGSCLTVDGGQSKSNL